MKNKVVYETIENQAVFELLENLVVHELKVILFAVRVVDVPDKPPEFVSVPSMTRVPEDVPKFSEVGKTSKRSCREFQDIHGNAFIYLT